MSNAAFSLRAELDGAGDGWVDVSAMRFTRPLLGMKLNLVACPSEKAGSKIAAGKITAADLSSSVCRHVAVFGGSGGGADRAGWVVSAGCKWSASSPWTAHSLVLTSLSVARHRHAMSHGIFGFCFANRTLDPTACAISPSTKDGQACDREGCSATTLITRLSVGLPFVGNGADSSRPLSATRADLVALPPFRHGGVLHLLGRYVDASRRRSARV